MPRRLAELVPFGEKGLDEPADAPVVIRPFCPIGDGKHGRNHERVDRPALRNERRIFLVRQLAETVVVGERLRERNR